MELLPLVCFCLLICSGTTFGDEVIKMRVKEDEDVILPCSLDSTNIRNDVFDWKKDDKKEVFLYEKADAYNSGRGGQDQQFKGRVFHFEDQLQSGNASIVIRKSKVKDSGSYSCIFPHHQPRIRSIIELIVDCILKDRTEEKINGSSPEPSVTIHKETKDWALLECKVQGVFPKPKVQWLDSENKTVPAEEPQETESEGKYNIILKTTVTKSDVYRCVSTQEEICHQIDRKIKVSLHVIKMRVKPGENVTLRCSFGSTNIRTEIFDWKKDNQTNVFQYVQGSHYNNGRGGQDPQFKGRVFHFEDQLQSGDASIEIRTTNVTDSGNYSCSFPHHQLRSTIELIVGSCPKPSVTILDQTNDQALLQCEVQGVFPKPKVQWLDSENNRVPAEESQDKEGNIILKATVTKSDVYRCVSTQEAICHQIDRRMKVYLHGSSTGWIVGVVVGLVVAFVLGVGLTLFVCWCKKQYSNRNKHEETIYVDSDQHNGDKDPDGIVYGLINRCLQCLRRQNEDPRSPKPNPIGKVGEDDYIDFDELQIPLDQQNEDPRPPKPNPIDKHEETIYVDDQHNDKDPVVYEDPIVMDSNGS